MTNDYVKFQAPSRRRDALAVLLNTRGYCCSELLLQRMVREMGGYNLSAALLRDDLHWLAERRLVKNEERDGVLFATLIERGRDVANGDEHVDGVEWPDVARE